MRVDLVLGGGDVVKTAFRDLSAELDKLNQKLNVTINSLQQLAAAASQNFGASASGSGISAPPIASPPSSGSSGGGQHGSFNAHQLIRGVTSGNASGAVTHGLLSFARVAPEIAIAAAALVAFTESLSQTTKAVRDYADFTFNARGGSGAARGLAGISAAAGVSLDEASGLASERAGGAAQLNREIARLRSITDDQEAARYAKSRGIEAYRSVRNMSDEQFNQAQNAPGTSASGIRAIDQAATDLNQEWQKMSITLQNAIIPVAASLTHDLARLVEILNMSIEGSGLYRLLKWMGDMIGGGANDPGQKMSNAADKMDDAANKIKDATYGGPRTKGAVPSSWQWYQESQNSTNRANRLGSLG